MEGNTGDVGGPVHYFDEKGNGKINEETLESDFTENVKKIREFEKM